MIRLLLLFIISHPTLAAEKLAYLEHVNGYWQVFVSEDMGVQSKQITHSEFDKNTLSWVSSGNAIFVSGIQGEVELHNLVSNAVTDFTLPHNNVNDAVMSPDTKYIAYSAIDADNADNKLWLYMPDKKHKQPVHQGLDGRQHDPQWRQDGMGFYFVSGDATSYYDIRYIGLADKSSKQVVSNGAYNFDPVDAGNKQLLFSSNIKSDYDIWQQNGDQAKRITYDEGSEIQPAWSQLNGGVYYVKSDKGITNIWFTPLEDNAVPKQITHSLVGARAPSVYYGVAK